MESETKIDHPKVFVHEFLIDFLGALVPGILFTIAIIFALTPIFRAITAILSKEAGTIQTMLSIRAILKSTQNTPSAIWVVFSIFGLLLSYTLGHLFYRRDPRDPDAKSFKRLAKRCPHPNGSPERIDWLRRNLASEEATKCEFPYKFLYEYLENRGHFHLLSLVHWRGGDKKTERSKTYINRLKVRLEVHHPEKCRPLIRNEAHVRLASSMWYVGRLLWKCSLLGILVFITSLCVFSLCTPALFPPTEKDHLWCAAFFIKVIFPSLIVICFARYCQYAVENFLLYQRLREIFYVLEVAYTCFRDNPDLLNSPILPSRPPPDSHRDMD